MTPKQWARMVQGKLSEATMFDCGPHGIPSPDRHEAILEEEVAKLMSPLSSGRWVNLGTDHWVDGCRIVAVSPYGNGLSQVHVAGADVPFDSTMSPAEVMAAADAARAETR